MVAARKVGRAVSLCSPDPIAALSIQTRET